MYHLGACPVGARSAVELTGLNCGQERRGTRVRKRQHATKGRLTVAGQKTLLGAGQLHTVGLAAVAVRRLAPFPLHDSLRQPSCWMRLRRIVADRSPFTARSQARSKIN